MSGIADQLGDLSWLGDAYTDLGWVIVGEAPPTVVPAQATTAELAWDRAKQMLRDSDWAVLPDVPMANAQKSAWLAYRKALREVRLQAGFPDNIQWPKAPE